jgi:hypothetical protein
VRFGGTLLVLLAACASGQPDAERLGDSAWHDGRWKEAVADYRTAGNSPRLVAKAADAALQGEMLTDAATEWTLLGTGTQTRAGEAAAGLVRVAEAANRDGNQQALGAALLGLRQVAPGWPLGRLAIQLAPGAELSATAVATILPAALAANTGHSLPEPVLAAIGQADRSRGACDAAAPVLEGVLRRGAFGGTRDSAAANLAWCDLTLGLAALGTAKAGEAELWFDRAIRENSDDAVGRRAMIGLGDARRGQGDLAAASAAWQSVASRQPADSLTQIALQRLTPPEAPAAYPDTTSLRVGSF